MMGRTILAVILALALLVLPEAADARGGGGRGGGRGRSGGSRSGGSRHRSGKVRTRSPSSGRTNSHRVHVRGFKKKDGTVVAPHTRTAPNRTRNDNFSTKGNVNPDTGKPGTKPADGQ